MPEITNPHQLDLVPELTYPTERWLLLLLVASMPFCKKYCCTLYHVVMGIDIAKTVIL